MRTGELVWSLIPEDFICGVKKIFIYLLSPQVAVHLLCIGFLWVYLGKCTNPSGLTVLLPFSLQFKNVIKLGMGGALWNTAGRERSPRSGVGAGGRGELAVVGAGHTRGVQGLSSGSAWGREG